MGYKKGDAEKQNDNEKDTQGKKRQLGVKRDGRSLYPSEKEVGKNPFTR